MTLRPSILPLLTSDNKTVCHHVARFAAWPQGETPQHVIKAEQAAEAQDAFEAASRRAALNQPTMKPPTMKRQT